MTDGFRHNAGPSIVQVSIRSASQHRSLRTPSGWVRGPARLFLTQSVSPSPASACPETSASESSHNTSAPDAAADCLVCHRLRRCQFRPNDGDGPRDGSAGADPGGRVAGRSTSPGQQTRFSVRFQGSSFPRVGMPMQMQDGKHRDEVREEHTVWKIANKRSSSAFFSGRKLKRILDELSRRPY